MGTSEDESFFDDDKMPDLVSDDDIPDLVTDDELSGESDEADNDTENYSWSKIIDSNWNYLWKLTRPSCSTAYKESNDLSIFVDY